MPAEKKDSGIFEAIAVVALLLLLWKYLNKKKGLPAKEPAITKQEIIDEFSRDSNFNLDDYCKDVIYKPLASTNLTESNLLGAGWCYRGDRSAIDPEAGFGDAYADEQADDYQQMKQDEAVFINNRRYVQFRLINDTLLPITTNVLNTTEDSAPFSTASLGAVTANPATLITSSGFVANWDALTDATGYYLDVATDISFTSLVSGYNNKDVGDVTNYIVSGLDSGTLYYYRLRAYNASTEGSDSNIESALTIPGPVTASAATGIGGNEFTANWQAETGATGYYLDVATDVGFTSFVAGFENKDVSDVTTYDVTGLDVSTDYYYRIRAYNGNGAGDDSNTITLTTYAFGSVTIGSQVWADSNVKDNIAGSRVYDDNEANRALYGGLYDFSMIAAIEALYPGWHVPTLAEWVTLANELGGYGTAGGHLKEAGTLHWNSPNTGADNSSGFTALPGGYYSTGYSGINTDGDFWTSTPFDATFANFISLYYNFEEFSSSATLKTYFFSVRLIKD